jgi:hypothetical protein
MFPFLGVIIQPINDNPCHPIDTMESHLHLLKNQINLDFEHAYIMQAHVRL